MKQKTIRAILCSVSVLVALALSSCATASDAGTDTSASTSDEPVAAFSSFEELEGKTIACLDGAMSFDFLDEVIDDYVGVYYNEYSSEAAAVLAGKADAALMDEPIALLLMTEIDGLAIMDGYLADDLYGFGLQKGSEYTDDFDAIITQYTQDGTIDALKEKWYGEDDSLKTMPEFDYEGNAGTIVYAHDSVTEPLCYVGEGGESMGLEVELIMMIAYELDLKVEIVQTSFSSLISMLESGKADIVSGSMSITDERKESIDMTEAYYYGGLTVMTIDVSGNSSAASDESFIESIASSFTKNFITENRWQLIVSGIITTLTITVFAAVLGSVLGFGIAMMKMSSIAPLRTAANVYIKIFQGTPIVVVLMILYYIILADVAIGGTVVAILGFGLNFAAYVSEMMRTGIAAVDHGQREAAYALGFGKQKTFVKIVFPQAAKHFLPVFRGEFISMLKSTSIVGYIAVQDLTKMSDIIRSRTYEAFFPLIVTAIIYFILAHFLTIFITIIEKKIDPKQRKRELKGVNVQ